MEKEKGVPEVDFPLLTHLFLVRRKICVTFIVSEPILSACANIIFYSSRNIRAPKESEASRSSFDMLSKISMNRLTKRGITMTPNTIPPASTVYPEEDSLGTDC